MAWKRADASGLAPAPRGGHAVTATRGSLLLFGGADRSARAYGDLWQLRLGNDLQAEWTSISAPFPPSVACTARSGAALVAVGDKVYLFGGQEPNSGVSFHDVVELDTNTWTWTQLQVDGPRPPARHSCVAVSFKDQCMVVYGGAGLRGALSDLWVFNCRDKSWSSPRVAGQSPVAREMAAGVMVGCDKLLIHGGRASDGKVLNDVIQLHMGVDWSWGSSCTTPFNRRAHTLVAVPTIQQQQPANEQGETTSSIFELGHQQQDQQQLLIFGGFSGDKVEGSLWALQRPQHTAGASSPSTDIGWSVQQLHAGVDMQMVVASSAKRTGGGNSGVADGQEGVPSPRFAHAAACLQDPQYSSNQVMAIVGGVNPLEDLMDVYIWQ